MQSLLSIISAFFARLFGWSQTELAPHVPGAPPRPADLPDEVPVNGEPRWLQLARQDLGVREVPGSGSNPAIMRAWRYCDYDPPNGDETAWCSAKACEWVERAGLPSTRAPNARSWMKWGHELKKPRLGCIVVFWRGSPTDWRGHVALYLGSGSRPGTVRVIGGNQSNSVSIAEYSAAQVLSFRWPVTASGSRTLKAQTAGLIVGDGAVAAGMTGAAISQPGILESLPDALAIGDALQALATYWPWFMVIGIVVSILARMVTIYARLSDFASKGT